MVDRGVGPPPAGATRRHGLAAPAAERAGRLVRAWFADDDLGRWLGVNRHDGIAYVNRESFERALRWLVVVAAIEGEAGVTVDGDGAARVIAADELRILLTREAAAAGYQVGRLLDPVTAPKECAQATARREPDDLHPTRVGWGRCLAAALHGVGERRRLRREDRDAGRGRAIARGDLEPAPAP